MRRATLALLLFAGPALAEEPRFELHLNGLFAWGDFDFSETRSFRVLGRDLPVTAAYDLDSAFGFDLGLQVNVAGPLGLRASVSHATHEGSGSASAATPPPLLPFLPDRVSVALPDGRVQETAVHLAAALSADAGPLRLAALGGVTFFDLEARLLGRVDVVVGGGSPLGVLGAPLELSDSPVGWNLGLGVDLRLSKSIGVGGFLRYSRATALLVPPGGAAIELDAGGAHAGLGLRLRF